MLNVTAAETFEKQRDLSREECFLSDIRFQPNPGLDHHRVVADAERKIQPLRDEVAAMQAAVGGKVFRIPEQNLATLFEKIEKLNKRAIKLDVAEVKAADTGETTEVRTGENAYGEAEYTVFNYVVIDGKTPKLAGWQFAATLEHDENGVILRRLPGLDESVDLTQYRNADPANCDHCHKIRRRNDTYVVLHESGRMAQVGSSCLKDFLGGQSPERIAQWCSFLADLLDDLGDEGSEFYIGGSAPDRVNALDYMTHVVCMIRERGWTSRGSAYEYGGYATADAASDNQFNQARRNRDRQGCPLWIDPTDEDRATAEAAIAHVRSMTEDDLANEYVYNLFTVLKGESISRRGKGIAASAITFHRKAVQQEVEKKRKAESNFVGEVGEKLTIPVTISRIHEIADHYSYNGGSKPLYIMVDAEGNQIKWFSSRFIDGMEQGSEGTITGTVKKLEDDPRFGKSTVLTRCKWAA